MKFNWNLGWLATLPLLLLAGGCSGINASHSVSPLDFFMPGIGGFMYTPPGAAPIPTISLVTLPPAVMRDYPLAKAN